MWTATMEQAAGLVPFIVNGMREWDRREIFATQPHECDELLVAQVQDMGPMAWVAGKGDEPIAAFGCHNRWPGMWDMWFFATDSLHKIGLPVTRLIKSTIVPGLFRMGAHRLECRSMEGHLEAQRWLTVLGAKHECTHTAYGRGRQDFHVYVWGAC